MSIVHSDGLGQFQQDNVTPHASRVATKWLQKHSSDFRHFHWSPKSPDMNIIEDIRDGLLHAGENSSPPPRTPMDLWTILKDKWCKLPPRYLQALVEFMPYRVAALLCVRGALHDIGQVYQFFWLFSVYRLKVENKTFQIGGIFESPNTEVNFFHFLIIAKLLLPSVR
ncbi:hypothetical protein AVEN_139880-1 [Araneus ventricosus]|uniref:Tc1-like transposase DDE domain-containing protein n=1 Tax=Araneus ventricosus TaxID=182803 RepID=A0A4Y2FMQ7_ARAVE|nr:hypothetical protein AVEN_139880-1 [Araneus ventricosus]